MFLRNGDIHVVLWTNIFNRKKTAIWFSRLTAEFWTICYINKTALRTHSFVVGRAINLNIYSIFHVESNIYQISMNKMI